MVILYWNILKVKHGLRRASLKLFSLKDNVKYDIIRDMKKIITVVVILVVLLVVVLAPYNSLVSKDQSVQASWAQVETDYQRRSDLIPNLVATVKGVASFEQKTLTDVVDARARATGIQLNADDLTAEKIAQFEDAQTNLSGALSRLLVVAEAYPVLTASESFRGLQTQLEGTENRIAVSRKDFNTSVQDYNTSVKVFPTNIVAKLFGFSEKAYFESEEGSDQAPSVEF